MSPPRARLLPPASDADDTISLMYPVSMLRIALQNQIGVDAANAHYQLDSAGSTGEVAIANSGAGQVEGTATGTGTGTGERVIIGEGEDVDSLDEDAGMYL